MDTPTEPSDRALRALLSLEGLSFGDSFGEQFFHMYSMYREACIRYRTLPPGPWAFTDDTMMAISIFEVLKRDGQIQEAQLAAHFASLYDPARGYGPAMHGLLQQIRVTGGETWKQEAASLFQGRGSYGNGSAMRVAPLGAYFADDLPTVAEQARRSAATTHAHAEAAAGAIAVAVGAALAWRSKESSVAPTRREFLEAVLPSIPESEVRRGVMAALRLPEGTTVQQAGKELGCGWNVTAMDTVPFVLWSAATYLNDFEEAMWQTVSALGDRDTTCAMVGSIVVLRTGLTGISAEWRSRREPFEPLLS